MIRLNDKEGRSPSFDEYQSISVYQKISRQNIRLSEYQEVGVRRLTDDRRYVKWDKS
ncbi:hypothetical protein KAX35_04285 [candidate division WOR-3 bacterium]|nr:hypothetical protein [candidate division WOR-3 bacterium]